VSDWMLGSTWLAATVLLIFFDRWKLKKRSVRDVTPTNPLVGSHQIRL
jgi:hypothetical protein